MSDRGEDDLDARFEAIIAGWDDVESLPDPAGDSEDAGDPEPPGEDGPGGGLHHRDAANPPWPVWRRPGPAARERDDLDDVRPGGLGERELGGPGGSGADGGDADVDGVGDQDVDDEDEDDAHFVPGPTAPLPPHEDLHFWGIVVGLVAGPLLLLWLVIVRPAVSPLWTWLALALCAGGFVLLVLRQPSDRGGDGPDDGARV